MRHTKNKIQVNDIRSFSAKNLTVSRDTTNNSRQISGYAVTFNQPSKPLPFIEYISPHAFDNVDFSEVQLLYAHDYDNILARVDSGTLSLKVDDKGLFFVATIPDTSLGNDVYENVDNGNLKGLSFSAQIDPNSGDTWSKDDQGNVVHTINHFSALNEISLTSIPAYTETSVQVSRDYKEVLTNMEKQENEQPTSEVVRSAAPASSSSADNTNAAILSALQKLNTKLDNLGNNGKSASSATTKRDDEEPSSDTVDRSSSSAGVQQLTANTGSSSSSSASSATSSATPSSSTTKRDAEPASDIVRESEPANEDVKRDSKPAVDVQRDNKPIENEGEKMATKLNDNTNSIKRDFKEYLMTGQPGASIKRAQPTASTSLSNGSVLIPQTILTPEHETHQFPRLQNLVRTIAVSTTTGKLPVFQEGNGKLDEHKEFDPSVQHGAPDIKQILWDLKTYTANYPYSQELLDDSSYNWESELQSRLQELKDNTYDDLIINALTTGVKSDTVSGDATLVDAMKEVLNVGLKPQDSQAASVVASQSAFNALDTMKDKEGRYLVHEDLTSQTGHVILGKNLVIVDDTLFPKAKAGDINIVIAPLQKAVINFHENDITGKFIDTYDAWYRLLGIYMRTDVVSARPDLVTLLTTSKTTANAAASSTLTK